MRILRFEKYGTPDVLQLEEVREPEPGADEVLIHIKAAGINPSDIKNVAGQFHSPIPRIPGRDFAGVVAGGGAEIGLDVWGSGPGFGVLRDGAHAEYITMPVEWIAKKPVSLSMEQAAAVGVPYLTAWSALVQAGGLESGETVLIVGVSGAVGRAATQIAHWKGARVIGASTSAHNPSGADAVIDTTAGQLDVEVRALTDGKGVDLVLDAVGGRMFEPALRSLHAGGRQIAITTSVDRKVSFDLIDFYRNRLHLIGVNTMVLTGVETVEMLNGLRQGFDEGYLHPPEVLAWPLERAVEAYEVVARGGTRVKHVLIPHPTAE
ncbi:MAG: quinone oxidoreductase family protein [Thermoleophilia bacterium]|jgi:NADPH2:quinone reductase